MKTQINKPLLRKVRDMILRRPSQFVMFALYSGDNEVGQEPGYCGTAACIAGWATCLTKKIKPFEAARMNGGHVINAWDEAREALRITHNQATALFEVDGWPRKFREPFHDALTMERMAKIAAARINHFIKTGK